MSPEAVASMEELQRIADALQRMEAAIAWLERKVVGLVDPEGWDEAECMRVAKINTTLGEMIVALGEQGHLRALDKVSSHRNAGILATRRATVQRIEVLIDQRADPAKKRVLDVLEKHKALRPKVPVDASSSSSSSSSSAPPSSSSPSSPSSPLTESHSHLLPDSRLLDNDNDTGNGSGHTAAAAMAATAEEAAAEAAEEKSEKKENENEANEALIEPSMESPTKKKKTEQVPAVEVVATDNTDGTVPVEKRYAP